MILPTPPGAAAGDQRGFVLPAVLAAVAVLALVAAMVGDWLVDSLGRTTAMQARLEADARLHGTRQLVAWLMVTSPYTPGGLQALPTAPAVALDGRPFQDGPVLLSLLDGSGQYNLNTMDDQGLGELLRQAGVPLDRRAEMIAALLDYLAPPSPAAGPGMLDDAYRQAGLPPPRHQPLQTPWELRRVLSWSDPSLPAGLLTVVAASQVQGVNVNTAGLPVLLTLPGMTASMAEKLIATRSRRALAGSADVAAATGAAEPPDPLRVHTLPAGTLCLTMTAPGEPLARVVSLTLSPAGRNPIRVDYDVLLPASEVTTPPPPGEAVGPLRAPTGR